MADSSNSFCLYTVMITLTNGPSLGEMLVAEREFTRELLVLIGRIKCLEGHSQVEENADWTASKYR